MASLVKDPGERWRLLFVAPDGKRKPIRLGKIPEDFAKEAKRRIEDIIATRAAGESPHKKTIRWLSELGDVLYARLVAVGLAEKRKTPGAEETGPKPITIGEFLGQYLASRADIKPSTRTNLEQVRRNLVEYFGQDRPLVSIAPGDADEFRRDLLTKLGQNTVRRNCGRAKQFFRAALRKRLIAENPFGDMKGCSVQANAARFYFITREQAGKVLEACPDAQWRLLFALCRFGGLRCPSEPLGLRWGDIDWERNRITIRSPKTEHHEGRETRQIPIFPELRQYLEEVWEQAEPGTEFVITRYRSANVNLRTQLERIIHRAGLDPWPKTFQNLRSTRETELAQEYPMHIVCAWIGNTQAVAAKHYLQVRDEDFAQAAGMTPEAGQKAAHKAAQYTPGRGRKGQEPKQEAPVIPAEYEGLLECTTVQAPRQGLEQPQESSGNRGFAGQSGAQSGALLAQSAEMPPELAMICREWVHLPEAVRRQVVGMVKVAAKP